ncbi:TPA: DUF3265 domain-containing protein [Vibrio campbellii]|nr:DUF3265 domain-containing protein [Vibrio sp. LB10LO1]HDM8217900.1 DUF3265 domain-containing protein [Vibrio campbellii]HDM8228882.1 DUF3265 domain-containing protein [Vibrio campbellii]
MVLVYFFINVASDSRYWVLTLHFHITNCSRGIHHAWHFYYALVLVSEVVCVSMEV